MRRWWSSLLDFLPDDAAEVEELHDLGEMTLGRIRGRGHGSAGSVPAVETWWQSLSWRAGMGVWWGNFGTEAEALETMALEAG